MKHASTSTEPRGNVDLFAWELPGMDFPVYNDESLSVWQPALLAVASVLAVTMPGFLSSDRLVKSIIMLLGTLVPYLIISRGDIAGIIKRPRLRDIPLVIIALILTIVYSLLAATFLSVVLGLQLNPNALYAETRDSMFYLAFFIQLFAEEMFKLDVLLGVMTIVYERTGNRKKSVIVAVIATMLVFGLAHFRAYHGSILQILLIQGVGSIIDLFCYMRTKNILTSYAMHVLLDYLFI